MNPREREQGKNIANAGQNYLRIRRGHMVGRPIAVIDWVQSSRLGESRFSESENGRVPG